VVGSQSFDDPKVVVMVIVITVVGVIILMPLSRALARRGTSNNRSYGTGWQNLLTFVQ